MPSSLTNSQEEDLELPDALQETTEENVLLESSVDSPQPKTEPQSDPAIEQSPRLKTEEADGEFTKLEDIFMDDEDEDFLEGADDADLLASEMGALVVYDAP